MESFFHTFRLACLVIGLFYLGRVLMTGRIESRRQRPIVRAQAPGDFWLVWGVMAVVFALIMAGLFLIGR